MNNPNNNGTIKETYTKLLNAIANEKNSPELLEYEELALANMIKQIHHIEDMINSGSNQIDEFCIEQHQLEKNRLQFVVNTYLRIRIQKIEENSTSLIKLYESDTQRIKKLMSIGEIKYLDRYFMNLQKYLGTTILGKLNLPIQDTAHTLNLLELPRNEEQLFNTSYVFVKAFKQVQVVVDSEANHETITLEPDSIHFLPYSAVREYIQTSSNDVTLI